MRPINRIFVYGSLRPGSVEWASRGYTAEPRSGTTTGTLYDYGPFPYCDFDGTTTIVGDVLTLNDSMAWQVQSVEIGAGYVEREVTVTYSDGTTEQVIAYDVAPHRKAEVATLPVVASGDWVAHEESRWSRQRA